MPIIYVHGVSNRREDRSYLQGQQLRKRMVQRIVGSAFEQFPNMQELKEVYWGDLGVKFLWDRESLPMEITHEAVGDDFVDALGMAELLASQQAPNDKSEIHELPVERYSPLVEAARKSPSDLVKQFAYLLSNGLKETQFL